MVTTFLPLTRKIDVWGLQRTWIAQLPQYFLFVLAEVVSQPSFRSKSALDCQKLVFEVRACKNSYQSKMQTTLDHNFGCGAPIGLWARIITYHSHIDHWSGFELPESLISGVRFWCSHTLTCSERQKCKPNWAITLAVGHQSSSGLGLSFIMAMLITDRDLSSLRAVFAELGFGTVSLFKRTEDLVVFWSSLWEVNRHDWTLLGPQSSWNSLGRSLLSRSLINWTRLIEITNLTG